MHIISWILLGLLIALIANRLAGKRGLGLATDIVIGTAGASIVGFAFNTLADVDRTQLNAFGLAASAFGAGLGLALQAMFERPAPAPSPAAERRRKPRRIRR